MLFRQLFDRDTCTYTYVLACRRTREAVLIDPVRELYGRDEGLVAELGLKLKYVFETHVHADHVTSGVLFRTRLGARTVVSRNAGVEDPDRTVEDGEIVRFGDQVLGVRETPGHTSGCVTYVCRDGLQAFTGDALFVRGCGRTDFQGGSANTLYRSVHDKIFSLDDDCLLYPAHDYKGRTVTTVREERLYNPRLGGGRTEAEFVHIMDALKLSNPARIDVAVPANQRSGQLEAAEVSAVSAGARDNQEGWAPLFRTATGAPNVTAEWVGQNLSEVGVVDVREAEEYLGPLGHIPGARLAPLAQLSQAAGSWSRDRPLVVVCRSGGRSERGAVCLEQLGFGAVASLAGGMQRWTELGLPVEGGA